MYIETIVLKNDVSDEMIKKLTEVAEDAFDNRAGKVENSSAESHTLIYQGDGEQVWQVISLGSLALWDNKEFVAYVEKWTYQDTEEPEENCNIIEVYSRTDKLLGN